MHKHDSDPNILCPFKINNHIIVWLCCIGYGTCIYIRYCGIWLAAHFEWPSWQGRVPNLSHTCIMRSCDNKNFMFLKIMNREFRVHICDFSLYWSKYFIRTCYSIWSFPTHKMIITELGNMFINVIMHHHVHTSAIEAVWKAVNSSMNATPSTIML